MKPPRLYDTVSDTVFTLRTCDPMVYEQASERLAKIVQDLGRRRSSIQTLMPLFQCSRCGAVENTATGQYWGEKEKLCSECATGQWHGEFPKRNAHELGYFEDARGFIYPPNEIDPKTLEWVFNKRFVMVKRL